MKKIIITIICLALCTLALVACDSGNDEPMTVYTGDGSLHVISKNEVSNMPDMSHTLVCDLGRGEDNLQAISGAG